MWSQEIKSGNGVWNLSIKFFTEKPVSNLAEGNNKNKTMAKQGLNPEPLSRTFEPEARK